MEAPSRGLPWGQWTQAYRAGQSGGRLLLTLGVQAGDGGGGDRGWGWSRGRAEALLHGDGHLQGGGGSVLVTVGMHTTASFCRPRGEGVSRPRFQTRTGHVIGFFFFADPPKLAKKPSSCMGKKHCPNPWGASPGPARTHIHIEKRFPITHAVRWHTPACHGRRRTWQICHASPAAARTGASSIAGGPRRRLFPGHRSSPLNSIFAQPFQQTTNSKKLKKYILSKQNGFKAWGVGYNADIVKPENTIPEKEKNSSNDVK